MMRKMWNYISNRGLTTEMNTIEVIQVKIFNQYVSILTLFLFTNAIRDLIFGALNSFFTLLGICLMMLFSFFTFSRSRHIFYIIVVLFCLLFSIVIFYYSSTVGFENGLTFYYFALLSWMLLFFEERMIIILIIIIYPVVYVFFLIGHLYNFHLFGNSYYDGTSFKGNVRLITFTQVFLLMLTNGLFILKKNILIKNLVVEQIRKEQLISDLKSKIKTSSSTNIENLIKLAMTEDVIFIAQFKEFFPDFYPRLLSVNSNMTVEEFKFCAWLKLGFTTKEISKYGHITIRSAQTKKSRLRKSFNIPSEMDLYFWIDTF